MFGQANTVVGDIGLYFSAEQLCKVKVLYCIIYYIEASAGCSSHFSIVFEHP